MWYVHSQKHFFWGKCCLNLKLSKKSSDSLRIRLEPSIWAWVRRHSTLPLNQKTQGNYLETYLRMWPIIAMSTGGWLGLREHAFSLCLYVLLYPLFMLQQLKYFVSEESPIEYLIPNFSIRNWLRQKNLIWYTLGK